MEKELIILEGDQETQDFQIVSLQGDFYPSDDSQNSMLNGDQDFLEGSFDIDTATIDIPLNGNIYTLDLPLNGFKMPKMKMKMPKMKIKMPKMKMKMPKMKMKINTKGLSKGISSIGKGVSSAAKAYGDMVSHNMGQIGEIAQGAIGAGGGLLSSLMPGGSDGGEGEQEQIDETEQADESSYQDDEGIENLSNEDNEELNGILSTIGSAAGSFLMPGVGTAAGGMIGNMLESGGGMGAKKPTPKKRPVIKKRKATPKDNARYARLKAKKNQPKAINTNQQVIQRQGFSSTPQRQIALKSYPDGRFSLTPKVRSAQEETDANPTGNENNPQPTEPTNNPATEPKKKDDNTMLIVGGVAVAGILMLSMNKKGRK